MIIMIKQKRYNTKNVARKIKKAMMLVASATEYTIW